MQETPHKCANYNKKCGNSEVIKQNVNKIKQNDNFVSSFPYCIVKTAMGKTYRCKILNETKKTIKLQWFDCIKTVSTRLMSFGTNSIVGFTI